MYEDSLERSSSSNTSSRRRHHSSSEHALKELKRMLQAERQRATDAEKEIQRLLVHVKRLNQARLTAEQDATKAKWELKLYKSRLDEAQQEIYRAEDVVRAIDRQRRDAEDDAARAKSTARKLNQDLVLRTARDDGWRQGLEEGFEKGRALALEEARLMQELEGDLYADDRYMNDYQRVSYRGSSLFLTSSEESEEPGPPPAPQPEPEPVPVPPPGPSQNSRDIRPRSVHNASPSPRHSPVVIPPDNFIPSLDEDQVIRIPPPHELSRPPPTPERLSPALPSAQEEKSGPVPPRSVASTPRRSLRGLRASSPESSSTSMSQFDAVNSREPFRGTRTPLSAITEVLSAHTSPHPQSVNGEQALKHKPSWAASSHRSKSRGSSHSVDANFNGNATPIYTRPRPNSGSSNSSSYINPPPVGYRRSVSTVPDINIYPPTRPSSFTSIQRENPPNSGDVGRLSPISDILHEPLPPPTSPAQESQFIPPLSDMPGGLQRMPSLPSDEQPVIPDPALYGHRDEDSESTTDRLTTPVQYSRPLNGDTIRMASTAGDWASATQAASQPLLFSGSTLHNTPRSTVSSIKKRASQNSTSRQ